MSELIFAAIGLIVVFPLVIILIMWFSVRGLSNAILELLDDDRDNAQTLEHATELDDWADAHGFEWIGAYRLVGSFQKTTIAAWRNATGESFLCLYRIQQKSYTDLFTTLGASKSVTTSSAAAAMSAPYPPDMFVQAFPVVNSDQTELWRRHLEAVEFVAQRTGQAAQVPDGSFEPHFLGTVHRHMAFLRSLPFWLIQSPWWVCRAPLLANRPITERFASLTDGSKTL